MKAKIEATLALLVGLVTVLQVCYKQLMETRSLFTTFHLTLTLMFIYLDITLLFTDITCSLSIKFSLLCIRHRKTTFEIEVTELKEKHKFDINAM
jgi:hypothetical protein